MIVVFMLVFCVTIRLRMQNSSLSSSLKILMHTSTENVMMVAMVITWRCRLWQNYITEQLKFINVVQVVCVCVVCACFHMKAFVFKLKRYYKLSKVAPITVHRKTFAIKVSYNADPHNNLFFILTMYNCTCASLC